MKKFGVFLLFTTFSRFHECWSYNSSLSSLRISLRVVKKLMHKRPSLEREVLPFFNLPWRDGDPDVVDVGHGLTDLARQRILFEVDTFQCPARGHGLHIHICKQTYNFMMLLLIQLFSSLFLFLFYWILQHSIL